MKHIKGNAMAGVLVFDIETIPDAAGIRRLEGIPESVSDVDVIAKALAERKAQELLAQREAAAQQPGGQRMTVADRKGHGGLL